MCIYIIFGKSITLPLKTYNTFDSRTGELLLDITRQRGSSRTESSVKIQNSYKYFSNTHTHTYVYVYIRIYGNLLAVILFVAWNQSNTRLPYRKYFYIFFFFFCECKNYSIVRFFHTFLIINIHFNLSKIHIKFIFRVYFHELLRETNNFYGKFNW